MKKFLCLLLTMCFLIAVLAGCAGSGQSNSAGETASSGAENAAAPAEEAAPEEEAAPAAEKGSIVIRVASDQADTAPQSVALYQFEEDVEAMSGGVIDVQVYTNNALGGEDQYNDAVASGAVEIATPGTNFATRYPEFAAFDAPYLVTDWEETRTVLNSDFAKDVFDDMPAETGVRFLAFAPLGFRAFASKYPIEDISDMAGLQCRAPNIAVYISMINNWGAHPVVFSLTELYSAIEQGACDALELPVGTINANKFYEVAPNILATRHMQTMHLLVINEQFYQNLDEEYQRIIDECAANFQTNIIDLTEEYEAGVYETMAADGASVTEPTPELQEALVSAQDGVESVIAEEYDGSQSVIDGIRELLNK